jgi:hypothetical protein
MLWLIGIAGVWTICCLLAVALCVMARRGDEQLSLVFATLPDPVQDVDFVATIAAPDPAVPASATAPSSRALV